MADNVTVTAGSYTAVAATDDVAGVHYQRTKITLGADGAADMDLDSGQQTMANSVPVAIASNQSAVPVSLSAAVPAGTNNIGDVDVLTLPALPAGTNNIGDVDVLTLPALPAGTNNIGDVDVLSVVPGTGATNLGKAEDAAHTSADVGVMALAVRRDANTTLVDTDGDYAPIQVDANGGLKVSIIAGAGSGGTSATDDAAFTAGAGSGTPMMGFATADVVDSGDVGVVAMTTGRALHVAVKSIDAGNNNIGDVDVASLPANASVNVNQIVGAAPGATNPLPVRFSDGTAFVTPSAVDTEDDAIAAGQTNVALSVAQLYVHDGTDWSRAATNAGAASAQTLRVAVGDTIVDDAAFTPATTRVLMAGYEADETATDSVDEGDGGAARMTLDRKVITNPQPHTAGGLSIFRSLDLDETEEDVKTAAGQVYACWVTNRATATRWLKFYNDTAANVIVGTTTPVITLGIPGNSTDNIAAHLTAGGYGIAFSTAICVAATTGFADADTGAPGANDLVVNIFYK